jgi:hypothetical protein
MWISKWLMIAFLIVALMSPVKEIQEPSRFEGCSTLIVADSLDEEKKRKITAFIELRPYDAIALYVPKNVKIPLTHDHNALLSIIRQSSNNSSETIDYKIKEFLSAQERPWIVLFSSNPKTFVHSVPAHIETSIVPQKQWNEWMDKRNREHAVIPIVSEERQLEYFYFYPLFFGFMAMIIYLFGRNQKGFV